MSEQKSIVERPSDRLKKVMQDPTVREQFQNSLGDNSGLFVASLIDLYASDRNLQECAPRQVVLEALKAATLKLPINKNLGFAYVIPYKEKGKPVPQFQIGYKGLIQLAIRSGQVRRINADVVLEGELKRVDKLSGEIEFGAPTGGKVVGYFAFIETVNGFRKAVFWTRERVEAHAKRFSKSYGGNYSSPWKTDFDAMAIKTVLKYLLSKYGIMSIDMVSAFDADRDDEAAVQDEIIKNANRDFLDMDGAAPEGEDPDPCPPMTDEEKAAIIKKANRDFLDMDGAAPEGEDPDPCPPMTDEEKAAIIKNANRDFLDMDGAAPEGEDPDPCPPMTDEEKAAIEAAEAAEGQATGTDGPGF
jgi:recombination protein RecT